MLTPPYRIETERCVVRCWEPRDAHLLHAAIEGSWQNLRLWLPWAMVEPRSLAEHLAYLRRVRAQFDRDEDYALGVFSRDESRVLGATGFHKRVGPTALEIGYWIRSDLQRQGYCSEVVAALTRVALTICRAERVEIHCDPDNFASQAVPKKLGYDLEAVLRRRALTPTGAPRDTMVWSLFADELSETPSASSRYSAFGASGEPLPDSFAIDDARG